MEQEKILAVADDPKEVTGTEPGTNAAAHKPTAPVSRPQAAVAAAKRDYRRRQQW